MLTPFSFPAGLIRQASPQDAPGRYWDSNLVRWVAGNLVPIGGNTRVTQNPVSAPIRGAHVWRDNTNFVWTAIGREDGIGLLTDIYQDVSPGSFVTETSPTGGGYGALNYGDDNYGTARASNPAVFANPYHWSFANFGQDLLAMASQDGRLLHFTPQVSQPYPAMDVPATAPLNNTAVSVTAERMAVLLGCGGFPRRVGWSNQGDYTDYNFASTSNTAGFLDLEAASPLISPLRVKDGTLILTNQEVFIMEYVGRPSIYGVRKLGKTLFNAPRALCAAGNFAAWFGPGGFWKYDNGFVQPVPCPLLDSILGDIDPVYGPYRMFMYENGVFPEVWLHYPSKSGGLGECDRYVVWNYVENWFAWGAMTRTAGCGAFAVAHPFLAGADKHLYQHEDGWTDAGATRVGKVYAETACISSQNLDQVYDINQMQIASDRQATKNYRVKATSQLAPDGPETAWGPYYPSANGWMDTRITGRDIRLRFEATTDDTFGIGQIRLDIVSNGDQR